MRNCLQQHLSVVFVKTLGGNHVAPCLWSIHSEFGTFCCVHHHCFCPHPFSPIDHAVLFVAWWSLLLLCDCRLADLMISFCCCCCCCCCCCWLLKKAFNQYLLLFQQMIITAIAVSVILVFFIFAFVTIIVVCLWLLSLTGSRWAVVEVWQIREGIIWHSHGAVAKLELGKKIHLSKSWLPLTATIFWLLTTRSM